MTKTQPNISVKLADCDAEVKAAQALRYRVFVTELGGCGSMVDHDQKLELDRFDPYCDHLIALNTTTGEVVGAYRLMSSDRAQKAGQFYSEGEYDLTPLKASGRNLLELGRSCLHPDFRGGAVMFQMWAALSEYVETNAVDILFGVASFHGTDLAPLAQPLSVLRQNHLAPPELRARSKAHSPMDIVPTDDLDRKSAMLEMPALIKAYLRLGGFVGDGAFVDHAFNTTDVCLILDTARMNARQKSLYSKRITRA